MKTYTLTDKTWYRGQGSQYSYLNAGPGKPVCCLGNLLQQEGINVPEGAQDVVISLIDEGKTVTPELGRLATAPGAIDKDRRIFDVYRANDREIATDTERVALINEITEPFGFRFEFKPEI